MNLRTRMKRLTLTIAAAATLAGGIAGAAAPATQAAPLSFHYTAPGYSLQSGFLCLDTRNPRTGYTTLHCTRRYHRAGAWLVSDDPRWVPGAMRVGNATHGRSPSPSPSPWVSPTPAPRGISPWAYTGRAAYRFWDVFAWHGNKAALSYPFGWCTTYAAYTALDNVAFLGNARDWLANARRRGLPTGSTPRVGATVTFAPGVQGAGSLGHVAHVEAVYSGGWMLVSEMAFSWNGGGWGRVDYRYVHTGPGVAFIY